MSTIWLPQLHRFAGNKYEQLASAIGEAVSDGSLSAGSKLPPQRRLADALGITLGTVTRAYGRAIEQGWLEARVGDGTYVRNTQLVQAAGPLDLSTCQQSMTDQTAILGEALVQLGRDPERLTNLLGYQGSPQPSQYETVERFLRDEGFNLFDGKLVFTQGAQQGIFAALSAQCLPGDTVLHEAWCYPGLNKAAAELGLKLVGIPLTDEGLELEALEDAIKSHAPKALYLTPNNQNPACFGYSKTQRTQLISLAKNHNLLLIEDDVNYCTQDEREPTLWQLAGDSGKVVYLSSLSKRFAGGLRFGFMLLPPSLHARVNQSIHAQCWMVSGLIVELGCEIIRRGGIHQLRDQRIKALQRRFIEMTARLKLNGRSRGLNAMLMLPDTMSAGVVIAHLAAKGILVRSLADFGGPAHGLRLSFGRIPVGDENTVFEAIESTLALLMTEGDPVV
ncbi:PLP-dependent aminotransferase family protein [Shewanella sp. JM162201]|uniref:PLP-dependent aminotransferase family protein n=1 Tax=Shewanella jiangmenensis TaxID=2837387 RepID=A0ABS5V7N9_9GAMM|nr:PLP-dependent aminotransferase family protein [Shewanella jiangmenensis]MBT1445862.1 PLP-dependent aminotransferase family protein [Shewanella jiangmenensis]